MTDVTEAGSKGRSTPAITPGWIAEVTGGKLYRYRAGRARITGFSLDSRKLSPGEFFIALEGERTDGHLYLEEAFARGASGALVERAKLEPTHLGKSGGLTAFNIVVVEDTEIALWQLARTWREGFRIPIIGITGSSGKTTTKELLWRMLATRLRAYRSPGNYNTEYGLPLAILGMPPDAEVGVFELALQRPGEIGRLAELLRPQVGVITTIGDAHLGFFRSQEELAAAKWELIDRLEGVEADTAGSMAIINLDVSYLRERAEGLRGASARGGELKVIGFGLSSLAPCRYRAIEIDDARLEGLRFTLSTPQGALRVETKLLGKLNVINVLAAAAAALELGLGLELDQVREALEGFRPVPHRMELVPSPLGLIIDDSYNANPSATRAALRALGRLKTEIPMRKVVVLGEMLELGSHAPGAHRQLAREITAAGVELFFAIGELACETAQGLLELGWPPERVITTSSLVELEAALRERLSTLDGHNLILIKGSRALELDRLVEALTV